jgi:hypothetical protein
MEYIEKIKKMLCKELDEYAMKSKLTASDLEMVHKLTDTVKNLDKIAMMSEEDGGYSEARGGMRGHSYMHGSSYDDDMMYSERRGRGRNARRDSMGRYSSDMGSSYDDYSEARMDRRYSRDDAKDHMMNKLGSMMEDADPNEREILKDAMRKIERA